VKSKDAGTAAFLQYPVASIGFPPRLAHIINLSGEKELYIDILMCET
jgi:hypothetical protein